jgi:hypothetical protein
VAKATARSSPVHILTPPGAAGVWPWRQKELTRQRRIAAGGDGNCQSTVPPGHGGDLNTRAGFFRAVRLIRALREQPRSRRPAVRGGKRPDAGAAHMRVPASCWNRQRNADAAAGSRKRAAARGCPPDRRAAAHHTGNGSACRAYAPDPFTTRPNGTLSKFSRAACLRTCRGISRTGVCAWRTGSSRGPGSRRVLLLCSFPAHRRH